MIEAFKGLMMLVLLVAGEIVLVGELWVLRVVLDWWLNIDYVEAFRKWLTRL